MRFRRRALASLVAWAGLPVEPASGDASSQHAAEASEQVVCRRLPSAELLCEGQRFVPSAELPRLCEESCRRGFEVKPDAADVGRAEARPPTSASSGDRRLRPGSIGIAVVASGSRHVPLAYASLKVLRGLGCQWPVEVWHLGPSELPASAAALFESELGATVRDMEEHADEIRSAAGLAVDEAPHLRDPARSSANKCVDTDHPFAFAMPPLAVLLSDFERVVLMAADWTPFVNICQESLWRPADSAGQPHPGAVVHPHYAALGGLHYYPGAWRRAGLEDFRDPSIEAEVDESVLLVDRGRCPELARAVVELLGENARWVGEATVAAGDGEALDESVFFPCGTSSLWRAALARSGCPWHMSGHATALAGTRSRGPFEDSIFMGFGRVARAPIDGGLLGVHWQWVKYTFYFQRPDPERPPHLARVQLVPARAGGPIPDATMDVTGMKCIASEVGQHLHFVRYNSSDLQERTLTEWWDAGTLWAEAWHEAFTRVVACEPPDERCLEGSDDGQLCPPRPCRFINDAAARS